MGEPISEADLDAFLDTCVDDMLDANDRVLAARGLHEAERWWLDQRSGELSFHLAGGGVFVADAQIVGSRAGGAWLWAWANPSVATPLARAAGRVRDWGESRGVAEFVTPRWEAEEEDGWTMAAVARHLDRAEAVYRAPAGEDTLIFLTLAHLRAAKPE